MYSFSTVQDPFFFLDSAARNKTSQPRELVELVCNAHVALSSSTYVHTTYVHIDVLVENCACKKTHDKNADSIRRPGWLLALDTLTKRGHETFNLYALATNFGKLTWAEDRSVDCSVFLEPADESINNRRHKCPILTLEPLDPSSPLILLGGVGRLGTKTPTSPIYHVHA